MQIANTHNGFLLPSTGGGIKPGDSSGDSNAKDQVADRQSEHSAQQGFSKPIKAGLYDQLERERVSQDYSRVRNMNQGLNYNSQQAIDTYLVTSEQQSRAEITQLMGIDVFV
jgi:hypothetical protein